MSQGQMQSLMQFLPGTKPGSKGGRKSLKEQPHLYVNKAKIEMRHSCLKHVKNEIHAYTTR